MYHYFRTYVIMPYSEVVSTKSKHCVQVAAEDGKEDAEQQETPSAIKENAPEDKDKDEEHCWSYHG